MVKTTAIDLLSQLSCSYRNSSDRMVIVRCIGPSQFFLERVVFPVELLNFLAPPESVVEIWTHSLGGAELLEDFPASDLQLNITDVGIDSAATLTASLSEKRVA